MAEVSVFRDPVWVKRRELLAVVKSEPLMTALVTGWTMVDWRLTGLAAEDGAETKLVFVL